MAHPPWLAEGFAAAIVVVGGYCLTRLVAVVPLSRRSHYDVNFGHVLMAIAMVGALVPGLRVLPNTVWTPLFAAMVLWFLLRAGVLLVRVGGRRITGPSGLHVRHYAVHAVMASAMVYMDAASPGMAGRSSAGMGAAAGAPSLTVLFMVVLLASAVWQLNGIERPTLATSPAWGATPHAALHPGLRPGMAQPLAGTACWPPRGGAEPQGGVQPVERPWLAPRLEVACHVAMCLAMAYMLVLMV